MSHAEMIEAVAEVAATKIKRDRINFFDMEEIAWESGHGKQFDAFAENLSSKQKERNNSLDDLIDYADSMDRAF